MIMKIHVAIILKHTAYLQTINRYLKKKEVFSNHILTFSHQQFDPFCILHTIAFQPAYRFNQIFIVKQKEYY